MIQESRRSVLTNQCFGKETNAEPPGRGNEESFLTDSDKFIVERHDWGQTSDAAETLALMAPLYSGP